MWDRTIVLLVCLQFYTCTSQELCDNQCITLCNKIDNSSKSLLVRKSDIDQEEINFFENVYEIIVLNLTCGENEYIRSLKLSLYDEDKWIFLVNKYWKFEK